MSLSRYISAHRPTVLLVILVTLSVVSLFAGTEASRLQNATKKAVSVTAYPFLKAYDLVGDGTDYVLGFVFEYDQQRQQNELLRKEAVALKMAVLKRAELERENQRLRRMMQFIRHEPRLSLEPAKVIESYKGMLRLDRGSVHDISESMCVVAEDGVVGVVTEVALYTAIVATLHHPACKIGAMVQRNRLRAYDGVIHASSDPSTICTMDYIDMKDEVRKGDAVVTSPESLFPSGYRIGTISAPPRRTGSLWKTAEVQPAVDPYRLDEVFVIRKAAMDEDELLGPPVFPAPDEQAASMAPKAPDNRPLQERFAP